MYPPKYQENIQEDLFKVRLDSFINIKHELVRLAQHINWQELDEHFSAFYARTGRPGNPTRLMIGLHILKHVYKLSDEEVCAWWAHSPYFQYFCGETFFQHRFPHERSSMTHWRNRVGDKSLEKILQESLIVALKTDALKPHDLQKIVVDTTVQEKAITYPTTAKLHYKAIERLNAAIAQENETVTLRQSFIRVAKQAVIKVQRYRHAKQMKRAKKMMRKLNTYLGRLIRDIERKVVNKSQFLKDALSKASRIFHQKPQDKEKLLSWHAPEVECISKGKPHKPYEFGCKVSVITTLNRSKAGHFVLQADALHNNPYDGHTLKQALENYTNMTGIQPRRVFVDKGYRGHDKSLKPFTFHSGMRKLSSLIKRELRRRPVIEPLIGHLKNDGLMKRNYLKGFVGDKINALFSAIGHNFRLLLTWCRDFFAQLSCVLFTFLKSAYLSFENYLLFGF